MKIVLDIEGDNLLDTITRIHVCCVYVMEEDKVFSFRSHGELIQFLQCFVEEPLEVITFNGVGYDLPALYKVWGIPYHVGKQDSFDGIPCTHVDLFHLSQFLNPDRVGGHSLDNLARAAGGPLKSEYKGGFDEYTEDMRAYCESDTKATASVYHYLLKEAALKYGG